jgi:hypothetical protein
VRGTANEWHEQWLSRPRGQHMSAPLADPIAEGRRLVAGAEQQEVLVRLTGGVGVACVSPSASKAPLKRAFKDIDIVGLASQSKRIVAVLAELGYEPDLAFNALNGATRLLHYDRTNGRQLDVFLDGADLCHYIDLKHRLALTKTTLSVSDLLLMKLQVYETNAKDYTDIVALCIDHTLGLDPLEIDVGYFQSLVVDDWGLWKTLTVVAGRTRSFVHGLEDLATADLVDAQLGQLVHHLEDCPKSRKWGLRARVGERKRWYNLPE